MKKTLLAACLIISIFSFAQDTFRLDSLKFQNWEANNWADNLKQHFYFDTGGTNDTRQYQFIYQEMTWDSILRAFKTYDSNLNLAEVLTETFNEPEDNWIEAGKEEFSYIDENLLSIESQFIPLGGGQWLENDRKEYTYDNSENIIEEVYKILDIMTFQLENTERRTHSYTGNLVDEDIFQDWVNNNWLNRELREYSYTAANFPEEILISEWENNMWSPPFERNTFFYDNDEFNTEILVEKRVGNAFENDSRTLNTFDNTNLVQLISQEWVNNAWENVSNLIQNYDSNSNIEEQITQIWNVNDWVNQARVLSYWSPAENLSVSFETITPDAKLHPNPTNNILTITFKQAATTMYEATLYDVLGKQLKSKQIPEGHFSFKFDISSQSKGVYILKLSNQNSKQVFRIVKS